MRGGQLVDNLISYLCLNHRDLKENRPMMSAAQLHELPWYVALTLWASTLIALAFAFFSSPHRGRVLGFLVLWIGLITGLSFVPLSLPFWALSTALFILVSLGFLVPSSKTFLYSLDVEMLHYLHLWRLPFAFVFLWLYQAGYSGLTSTFEGLNYDIVIGLTAPVIASLAFSQKMLNREILIGWNVLGLLAWGIAAWLTGSDTLKNLPLAHLFGQLPYVFYWGFLIPISLLSHLLSLAHLFKGDINVEE